MKRRSSPEVARLRRELQSLEAAHIDRLYGLEPLWEPGGAALAPEEFVPIRCPYCGERWATRVDLTAEEPAYVEDCHVCCRPIEFHIEREDGGALHAVRVQTLD